MINYALTFGVPAGIAIVAMLVVGFLFSRLYHRSTRDVSLIRTGAGGRKVIMDGGVIVVPGLHDLVRVSMKTTRLEIERKGEHALITKDRMRVDAGVEFYVAVQSEEAGIASAAQTLGNRTGDPEILREMFEGKLVSGLRSVAAGMNLDELHEKRNEFTQQVQQAVSADLAKNGLALESAALTKLDQTKMDGMDENNVFNAMGLQNQAMRIAVSKKERARVEAETSVAVAQAAQEGEIQILEINRVKEEARVTQNIEMQSLKSQEEIDKATKEEEVELKRSTARIDREKAVRQSQIDSDRDLEIAEQNRQISVQEKSREESDARAEADESRAKAAVAEESVRTARDVATAERSKKIVILQAEQAAEESATSIRVSAKAEREAANDRAEAVLAMARANAEEIQITADANKHAQLAEAEGTMAQINAENTLSADIIDFRLAKEKLAAMPGIIAEMVKPAEKIGNISIHKVDGFGGSGSASNGALSTDRNAPGVVNQAFDQMRAMALEMPMLKSIGAQVGLSMDKPMSEMVGDMFEPVENALTASETAKVDDVVEDAPQDTLQDTVGAGTDEDLVTKVEEAPAAEPVAPKATSRKKRSKSETEIDPWGQKG